MDASGILGIFKGFSHQLSAGLQRFPARFWVRASSGLGI